MSNLFDKSDIAVMSPITQKLDALLKAEGFSMLETNRVRGSNNTTVNKLVYMREEGESVFLFTNEPMREAP